MTKKKRIAVGTFAAACADAAYAVVHQKAYQNGFHEAREEYLEDIEAMCNGIENAEITVETLEEEIEVLRDNNRELRYKLACVKAENDVFRRMCPPIKLHNGSEAAETKDIGSE